MATDRRTFLMQSAMAGLAASALGDTPKGEAMQDDQKLIKPRRLAKGQTVGVIAPASNAWEDDDVRYAVEIVQSLGFKVKQGKYLFQRHGYLAGGDQERAEDLNRMFADDGVDAIMCLRGGYGTLRILPDVDYQLIAKNPKPIIGYSDITALLNAIYAKTGLVTFHGPIARQEYSEYTLAEFKRVMMGRAGGTAIGSPPPFEPAEGRVERENRLIRIAPGRAEGRLIGGNLSLMSKLVGTPYEPDYSNRILVLEEVDERPYRVDGMLTQLWLAGRLGQLAGIAFGKCSGCDPESPPSLSLEEVLRHRLGALGIPVLRGLMIGHVRDQTTVPLGTMARLDVGAGQLTLLEDPVA